MQRVFADVSTAHCRQHPSPPSHIIASTSAHGDDESEKIHDNDDGAAAKALKEG